MQMKRLVGDGDNEETTIHVLVAEDDSFQRLALIDILTLCNYEVTAVENGRLARDELLKENQSFDVVLLDLMMPEMHGLELLCLMQVNEKLKNIPVIMMSSDGERDIVAACLAKGAKDYLVKPLRITMVKGIAKHVVVNAEKNKNSTSEKVQYKKLNVLGQGAAGSVELVRRTDNGELFALKIIPLHFMSQQEKKLAESEVTLLKVLVAPTIIRYYDSFVESDSICIVMEYAKAGSLYDKIQDKKVQGEKFEDGAVLYYIAQLIVAVMFMHSKNILHRDIKTQNMFLTSENIVKLGDFGIAKALGTNADMTKTLVGTPYFMSPEVCKGEQYGQKADIWSIGCTLYELVMLRRPFQHDNINVLFDKIKNEDPDPVDEECSQDIKVLIETLLNKDPSRRPSAWELSQLPCIFKCIERYYKEEAPDDAFLEGIINQSGSTKKLPTPQTEQKSSSNSNNTTSNNQNNSKNNNQEKKEHKKSQSTNDNIEKDLTIQKQKSPIDKDAVRLLSMVKALRSGVKIEGISTGLMSYEANLVKGEQIQKWLKEHYPGSEDQLSNQFSDLLSRKYIQQVIKKDKIEDSYYRFQQDIPGIPQNFMYVLGDQELQRGIFELFQEIIDLANQVVKEVTNNIDMGNIIEEKLFKSKKFQKFEDIVCELQLFDLQTLNDEQKNPFFANLLQIMYFHQYMRDKIDKNQGKIQDPTQQIGFVGKLLSYIPFVGPQKNPDINQFQYIFKGQKISIEELKHGIIRCNKKPNFQSNFREIPKSHPNHKLILEKPDQRMLFLFREENVVPKNLVFFNPENFEHDLNKLCKSLLNLHVCFDSIDNDITIHKIFQLYSNDFNNEPKNIIEFIFNFVKNLGNKSDIIQGIEEGTIFIQYEEHFE